MKKKRIIKVLIVDDSVVYREMIARQISEDEQIEVVGKASSSFEARDMIINLRPDVMTLDVEMPKMDGIEFLKKLMPQYPLPTIVVSSASERVFDALNNGAVDFVEKPKSSDLVKYFIQELLIKIKIASTAKVGHHKKTLESIKTNDLIIAIGASTGGTNAIDEILKKFTKDMPGTVIVQHMPEVFTKLFADRLNNECMVEVKEAENGDEVLKGRVIIAPGKKHMRVVKKRNKILVELEDENESNKVNGHCPSVDVLFNSVAENIGMNVIGIVLTGMGKDGAEGLHRMKQKGARTIGQDEASSVVYGMPKVAYEKGSVDKQAPISKIFDVLMNYINDSEGS
ncbi:MAG: chemotaxis response regulator protein-glutamate methylesterase [Bacillota bacterium]|nr:chemotaxis response regulator protein-glutamate methylesterase [Bacillota bacterium]